MFYQPKNEQQEQPKKTYKKDERFFKFILKKSTLHNKVKELLETEKDEKEINRLNGILKKTFIGYQFVIIPFKENNFLEQEILPSKFDIVGNNNTMLAPQTLTVNNFLTSDYKKKTVHTQYNRFFRDLTLQPKGIKVKGGTVGVISPLELYFNKVQELNIDKSDFKNHAIDVNTQFVGQIYIVNDPVEPKNNNTLMLIYYSSGLLRAIFDIVNKKIDEEIKIIEKKEDKTSERDNKIEKLNIQKNINFENLISSKNTIINLDVNVGDVFNPKEIYDDLEVSEITIDTSNAVEYSLRDLITEIKDNYVSKRLRANLKKQGLIEEEMFEYKAFSDLYRYVVNFPNKLKVFNLINPFNLDDKLFYEENYTPTLPIFKNKVGKVNNAVATEVNNFEEDDDDVEYSDTSINVTNDDDDIPF